MPKVQNYRIIMSRSFHSEGNSANINVDSHLNTLRQRIEQLRKKEKLNTVYNRHENIGWNYISDYNDKHKKYCLILQLAELAGLAGSNIGFVVLSGSFCIFLVSLIAHMHG
nr:PREDICTED: uncharacterized protein LOC104232157 [Nicotiana sylvestris]